MPTEKTLTPNERKRASLQRRMAMAEELDRKERTKHPDFDRYWDKHQDMLWWFAHRAVKFFHHNDHAHARGKLLRFGGHGPEEYIGALVIRMNKVLYYFDESKGFQFSTYFQQNLYSELWRNVTRFFSISRDMAVRKNNLTLRADIHQMDLELADFDHSQRFYRIPDTDWDFVHDIIDSFDDVQDLWRFITATMDNRRKYILYATYKKGINLIGLGARLRVTKERVRQLLESAKQTVRERLKTLENFVRLFRVAEGDESVLDVDAMNEVLGGGTHKGYTEDRSGKASTVSDEVWFEVTNFFDKAS